MYSNVMDGVKLNNNVRILAALVVFIIVFSNISIAVIAITGYLLELSHFPQK